MNICDFYQYIKVAKLLYKNLFNFLLLSINLKINVNVNLEIKILSKLLL